MTKVRNKPLYRVKNIDTGQIYSYGTTKTKAKKQIKLLNMLHARKK
jgi:hypothetical protein